MIEPNTNSAKINFASDQEVRWCPGCGDYAILSSIQKILPELAIPKENFVFISGIGCAGRLPYYMNTYGFHTIHGRAPAVATGLKAVRPDLSVWLITGDGDALSIGGNHFMHLMRRNLDIVVLLFNNQIYGLTKGQYSPTSELGKVTKTSPHGTIDRPLNPIAIALAAGATFVARALDVDAKQLQKILLAAAKHKGTSFIEIYQNCNIFNDKAYSDFTEKAVRPDRTIYLEHGQPLLFGKNNEKGLSLNGLTLEIVEANKKKKIIQHDITQENIAYSQLLASLHYPEYPVPFGIFRAIEEVTYEERLSNNLEKSQKGGKPDSLAELFKSGHTWRIE